MSEVRARFHNTEAAPRSQYFDAHLASSMLTPKARNSARETFANTHLSRLASRHAFGIGGDFSRAAQSFEHDPHVADF
jgi:hypothetical protein